MHVALVVRLVILHQHPQFVQTVMWMQVSELILTLQSRIVFAEILILQCLSYLLRLDPQLHQLPAVYVTPPAWIAILLNVTSAKTPLQ